MRVYTRTSSRVPAARSCSSSAWARSWPTVAAGPGRTTDDGTLVKLEVKTGDTVIYSKYAGTEYNEGGTEYLIVRESDVLATVG